jgi:septal ring factor EnvC (AmiA/AmiB activator)
VSTFQGEPLGTADGDGTRDFLGRPISKQNVPGLLFSKEHNRMLREKEEEKARAEAAEAKRQAELNDWKREQESREQKLEEEIRQARTAGEHEHEEAARKRDDEDCARVKRYGDTQSMLKAFFKSRPDISAPAQTQIEIFAEREGRIPYPGEIFGWSG